MPIPRVVSQFRYHLAQGAVYFTLADQTMEEAGYSQWSANEPNNHQGHEYCVTIFKNDGKYNDIFCEDLYGFICEKEVPNN